MSATTSPDPESAPPQDVSAPEPRPNKRPLGWLRMLATWAVVALLLFLVAGLASPYWSVFRLRQAVARGDAATVAAQVDFPLLRESLKEQFQAQLATKAANSHADGFEALGTALSTMLVGPMVDALVTPEGLMQLMRGKELHDPGDMAASLAGDQPPPAGTEAAKMKIRHLGYEKRNRFAVVVAGPVESNPTDEPTTLIFMRRGRFAWKLTDIRLPPK